MKSRSTEKGRIKWKHQMTLDSYTTITAKGTEILSQLTSASALPMKKLKKNDVTDEEEVETVMLLIY
jgi:hypothetical protein